MYSNILVVNLLDLSNLNNRFHGASSVNVTFARKLPLLMMRACRQTSS